MMPGSKSAGGAKTPGILSNSLPPAPNNGRAATSLTVSVLAALPNREVNRSNLCDHSWQVIEERIKACKVKAR